MMVEMLTEDVPRVTLDRAFRGYRTQQVDAFLDQLVFAQRAGTTSEQLNELVQGREFSVVVGGYNREGVERLIEGVSSSWEAREKARQQRAEAEEMHQAVSQVLRDLVKALDEASQQLIAIDLGRSFDALPAPKTQHTPKRVREDTPTTGTPYMPKRVREDTPTTGTPYMPKRVPS